MNVLFTAINAKFPHTNIAIRYFNALCENIPKISCNYYEYTINTSKDTILQELIEKKPDVISFSCYIWNVLMVCDICKSLKKIAPDITVILGGPEVSFYDNIDDLPCDYLIKGEGELVMTNLLTSILNKSITPSIQKSDIPFDINLLPFPYTNELQNLNNRTLYYEASRGCPFRCSYCLSGSEHGIRFKDVNLIKSELITFLNADVRQVKFVDRTFNCNKKVCKEIWNFIKLNTNGITNFHFEISADLLDEEMMQILSDMPSGLIQLEVGVQSTNPQTLSEINRTSDLNLLFDRVDRINLQNNVHLHLDLIAGLPFEDIISFRNSFNDVFSHNPQQLQLGMLKLLKGSSLYNIYKNYDMQFRHYPPYEILSTNVLPYTDIIKLKKIEEVVDLYYNSGRFDSMLKYIMKKFATPFDFFFELGEYYYSNGHHLAPLSKDDFYNCLKNFYVSKFDDITDEFKELCRYDITRHEKPKKIPIWALANKRLKRNNIFDFLSDMDNLKKYLPEYVDFTARDMLDFIHIEIFSCDVMAADLTKGETLVLFNYDKRSILDRAETMHIELNK